MQKRLLFFLICMLGMQVMAQEEKVRITFNVGDPIQFNVLDVKDISFVEDQHPLDIVGEWFCEEEEIYSTFESFQFNRDGTLTWSPYFINYHSGNTISGKYSFDDYVISLDLGSIGQLTQVVTNHTETEYTVTSGGTNSVYYKVQKVYYMTTNDSPLTIGNEGDVITYVDNVFIGLEDGKIRPLKKGSGFALVHDIKLNTTVAYKIIVEYAALPVIDWTAFLNKTIEEIIAEFGIPNTTIPDDNEVMYVYSSGYNADISQIYFTFNNKTAEVVSVLIAFNEFESLKNYYNVIRTRYTYLEDYSSSTDLYFYDMDNSILIHISTSPVMLITYTTF